MTEKVGIILVNYKDYARRFLTDCRDGLRRQNYPADFFSVYIVDNGSSDETADYLKQEFREAKLIARADGNYAAALNVGARAALADGCEILVSLNMDVALDPDWLRELILPFASGEKIGIVQSKIMLYPGNEEEKEKAKINSIGNFFNFLGFGMTDGYNQSDRIIEGWPEIKGYASGCAFAIKKEIWKKAGGWDEEYYMYHDDIEISFKVKLAGYKIALAPRSVVYHKYEFSRSVKMLYFMERNRYLAIFHFYRCPTILLILPALILMEAGMFVYSLSGGWLKIKLRVSGYFLLPSNWRKIFLKRKAMKRLRTIKEGEFTGNFIGRVLFQEIDNPLLKYFANPLFGCYWRIAKKVIWW